MFLNQLTGFLGGFTLCGYRQKDGTLKSDNGEPLEDWPEEVTVGMVTYTLEDVVKGTNDFEEAQYV